MRRLIVLIVVLLTGIGAIATAGSAPRALPPPSGHVDVKVFAPRGGPGLTCARVYSLRRTVTFPAVLTGTMRALLAGPTAVERRHGYGGWFSSKTANKLRSVHVRSGVAFVDFYDLRRVIPNASSSCGSALLLAQLNKTATQFPTVRRAVYSFNGDRRAFYQWLQRDAPQAAVMTDGARAATPSRGKAPQRSGLSALVEAWR